MHFSSLHINEPLVLQTPQDWVKHSVWSSFTASRETEHL